MSTNDGSLGGMIIGDAGGYLDGFINVGDLAKLDFNDRSTARGAILGVNITFMVLIVLFMGARLYARVILIRRFQTDDALILVATITSLVCSIMVIETMNVGLGSHVWTLDLIHINVTIEKFAKLLNISMFIIYALALNLAKMSVIVMYFRVFPLRCFQIFLYAISFMVIGGFIATVFVVIFQCRPLKAAWDITIRGDCVNFMAFMFSIAGIHVFTDFAICFSPVPLVWMLKISKKEKLAVSLLIGVAFLACLASIIRLVTLSGTKNIDITFSSVPTILWSVAEVNIAIICASASTIKPILVKFLPSWSSLLHKNTDIEVNEIPKHEEEYDLETTLPESTKQTINSTTSLSISPVPECSNSVRISHTPPESPKAQRPWTFLSMEEGGSPDERQPSVNWDEYWKAKQRNDMVAKIDDTVHSKVEEDSVDTGSSFLRLSVAPQPRFSKRSSGPSDTKKEIQDDRPKG